MAQKSKVRDLVILVPGMMGSRLSRAGSVLWGDDSRTFLGWARRHAESLGELTIGGDDPGSDDLGDGIRATGLIEEPAIVVGRFLRPGGYRGLLAALERRLGLREPNLRTFPYDWRRDLRVASRHLGQACGTWLDEWRDRSGNPEARVTLLAHGAGGLVARHFVESEGGWRTVRRIVTVGTPYGGSVRALDLLYFGADFERYGISLPNVTPIVRTFTSVYQLLPQFPSVETPNGELLRPFEIRIPSFEQEKMERSRQLHRNLVDQHSQNRATKNYVAPATLAIIGIGQPTPERVRLLPSGMLSAEVDPHEMPADGDGVVSRFSAEAADLGFPARFLYVPQRHTALVGDPAIQTILCSILEDGRSGAPPPVVSLPRVTRLRSEASQERIEADALSVAVDRPFAVPRETIEVRVQARSAMGMVHTSRSARTSVRVEPTAGGKSFAVRVVPEKGRPGWLVARFRAPAPGAYRVVVSSANRELSSFRVREAFEVDEAKPRKESPRRHVSKKK